MLLKWDEVGQHLYETGLNHGVFYAQQSDGSYDEGVAWNGLISVSEKPSGAESTAKYADNIKYLNLISKEEFKATVEAFTYPEAFEAANGRKKLADGVYAGQQKRSNFGLVYVTKIGNDTDNDSHGEKIHVIYNAQVSPSEKQYQTTNENPDAITFSWELNTTPVNVTGADPTSYFEFDSTKITEAKWQLLCDKLFGTDPAEGTSGTGTAPTLPDPDTLIGLVD